MPLVTQLSFGFDWHLQRPTLDAPYGWRRKCRLLLSLTPDDETASSCAEVCNGFAKPDEHFDYSPLLTRRQKIDNEGISFSSKETHPTLLQEGQ